MTLYKEHDNLQVFYLLKITIIEDWESLKEKSVCLLF